MPAELVFAPEAETDISEAYEWYEDRRVGLGEDFLSCLDAGLQRICRTPEAHPQVYAQYRRALVRRFPYVVFYEFREGKVTLCAVNEHGPRPGQVAAAVVAIAAPGSAVDVARSPRMVDQPVLGPSRR